ncbi:hypothetical protein Egran_02664 [Elaphomyces granulatus]|uniref:Uncharacterized protein n=1 Tax=Elaphomyces granulatus TaxID=519963 RepID=A0A232LZJ2_9EURO|nr:hypothetical protein Egran_02664 [Elaphomyces granulatus]
MSNKYLNNIAVSYGDAPSSEPSDAISTIDGNNGDINAGQKGKYVWLSPKWSSESSNAVSNIRIIIQKENDPNFEDLAKGAGGDYRYLRLEKNESDKIHALRLLRRKDEVNYETIHALGFDGFSTDINKGRGGDYLYLVWKNK